MDSEDHLRTASSPPMTHNAASSPPMSSQSPKAPKGVKFVYDLRMGTAKCLDVEKGEVHSESIPEHTKIISEFVWLFFSSVPSSDGGTRPYLWKSDITELEFVDPALMKKPAASKGKAKAAPGGDGDDDDEEYEEEDEEEDGDPTPKVGVMKKPKAADPKDERKRFYSRAYHKAKVAALKKGKTPAQAAEIGKKAGRKSVQDFD